VAKGTHWEGKLDRTSRGFQQDIELAMGSDPLRAIIELVTNADDAYADTPHTRRGKIRIQVSRHRYRAGTRIIVMDRAKSMTPDEVVHKLASEGVRASGFEAGENRRGLLGRGAKDIVNFGPAQWECIKSGKKTTFRLKYENAPTDSWELDQEPFSQPREHATTVTLDVQPRFTVRTHDNMLKYLRRHFALRPILLDREHREVTLEDVNQSREDKVIYDMPRGKCLADNQRLDVPGYSGAQAVVSLWESDSTLDDSFPREYWQHSLLITSGRAAYEVFDGGKFSREPWSIHLGRLYGSVDVSAINRLIREYDDRLDRSEPIETANPLRLVKRDRSGLVGRSEHPFVEALYATLEEFLAPHIERIRAEAETQSPVPVNDETRRRLTEVGRLMSRLLQEESTEGGLEGLEGSLPPLGLSVIPSVGVFGLGEDGRLLVRFRPMPGSLPPAGVAVVQVAIKTSGNETDTELELLDKGEFFSRTLKVPPHQEGDICEVLIKHGEMSAVALLEWRNVTPPEIGKLEFEHARYVVKDGETRSLKLLAPWDLGRQL
jgi:hypothetical protein